MEHTTRINPDPIQCNALFTEDTIDEHGQRTLHGASNSVLLNLSLERIYIDDR